MFLEEIKKPEARKPVLYSKKNIFKDKLYFVQGDFNFLMMRLLFNNTRLFCLFPPKKLCLHLFISHVCNFITPT